MRKLTPYYITYTNGIALVSGVTVASSRRALSLPSGACAIDMTKTYSYNMEDLAFRVFDTLSSSDFSKLEVSTVLSLMVEAFHIPVLSFNQSYGVVPSKDSQDVIFKED